MTLKYRKYNMGSYNLHFIESNRFKTITMRINFKRKIEKYDITFRNFLKSILLESNKKYPTRRILEQKCEDLYGLNYNIHNILSGKYGILMMKISTLFLTKQRLSNLHYQITQDIITELHYLITYVIHFMLILRLTLVWKVEA